MILVHNVHLVTHGKNRHHTACPLCPRYKHTKLPEQDELFNGSKMFLSFPGELT